MANPMLTYTEVTPSELTDMVNGLQSTVIWVGVAMGLALSAFTVVQLVLARREARAESRLIALMSANREVSREAGLLMLETLAHSTTERLKELVQKQDAAYRDITGSPPSVPDVH